MNVENVDEVVQAVCDGIGKPSTDKFAFAAGALVGLVLAAQAQLKSDAVPEIIVARLRNSFGLRVER